MSTFKVVDLPIGYNKLTFTGQEINLSCCLLSLYRKKDCFTVEVPDLPGCVSEGKTLADAILMATDAASGWVLDELEDGRPATSASAFEDIIPNSGGFVTNHINFSQVLQDSLTAIYQKSQA